MPGPQALTYTNGGGGLILLEAHGETHFGAVHRQSAFWVERQAVAGGRSITQYATAKAFQELLAISRGPGLDTQVVKLTKGTAWNMNHG